MAILSFCIIKQMKKVLWFFVPIIIAVAGYAGWFYWNNLRGAAPAISSPSETPEEAVAGLITDPGFSLSIFAKNLINPRVMAFDPSGVLVTSITSERKVVALPDENGDGKADVAIIVAQDLNRPHGLAFRCFEKKCSIYIAETDGVSIYDYDRENFKARSGKKIIDLPSGGNHFTRTILIAPVNGEDKLLISVGSSCNVCRENDWRRAKILYADLDGGNLKEFSSGLRNAVFMTLRPGTDEVWVTEMGRDLIGDDVPPDEINILKLGSNFGWPICYGKNIHDTSFDKNVYVRNPCMEPFETPSLIDVPAHSAPLGLAFTPEASLWSTEYRNNLFVALHGSWNRTVPTGYKIVRYKLDEDGMLIGEARDFVTGWLKDGASSGRPADIVFDKNGNMFISDDKAGAIYRVSKE